MNVSCDLCIYSSFNIELASGLIQTKMFKSCFLSGSLFIKSLSRAWKMLLSAWLWKNYKILKGIGFESQR